MSMASKCVRRGLGSAERGCSYMNGPIALLHVVGSEKIGHASQSMEETVFETEDWCGSNDCCFREDTADDFLASSLDEDLLVSEARYRPK